MSPARCEVFRLKSYKYSVSKQVFVWLFLDNENMNNGREKTKSRQKRKERIKQSCLRVIVVERVAWTGDIKDD